MNRRRFLKSATMGMGAALSGLSLRGSLDDFGSGSGIRIKKVSYYHPPTWTRPLMAQSRGIVVVECDNGMIGVGEGGSLDTVSNLAGWVIGQDPMKTEHLWQLMFRGYFYPAGRELQHAMGAIDMALWDIKGKLLDTPVFNLLGGQLRNYIYCYSTGYPSRGRSVRDTARACVESGFKAYRTSGNQNRGVWDVRNQIKNTLEHCNEVYEGVRDIGDWAIDLHTRFAPPHAVRVCNLLEELDPLFVEDLVRSENQDIYRSIRNQVSVPIAVGEQFGVRWDWSELVENDLIDYGRVTLPNVGGITEFQKIMAMCETHYVGIIPHSTGPVSTAALTHCLAAFTGFGMMEMRGEKPDLFDYVNPDYVKFSEGKLYPRNVPGLGVDVDTTKLEKKTEITDGAVNYSWPLFRRPDGSFTNW